MRLAVIGANGMLGRDMQAACRRAGIEARGLDLPEIDITRDGGMDKIGPCDWIVNVAAFTDVDGAETKSELAFAVNADGAGRVARWCAKQNTRLIHISTDYVFDGSLGRALKEDDRVNPLSVYGESKLAGEELVKKAGCKAIILRTQVLFGVHGKSFIKAIMAKLGQSDEPLRVVTDQTVCPTYTVHLAEAILRLMKTDRTGIVHVSAAGSCTWYEFARAIAARVKPSATVIPVTAKEFPRPARRPAYSALDKSRYQEWTGHQMPSWEKGLDDYLEALKSEKSTI